MSERITRRSFFKLAGGGVAAAVIAPTALLGEPITQIPVEYGFTWHVDKTKIPSTLSEIITETLRKNSKILADNVSQNNALLMKLKDNNKVLLRVEKISPEEQTKRMADRLEARIKAHKYKNYANKKDEIATFYDGYEDLEKKYIEKPYGESIPHIRAIEHKIDVTEGKNTFYVQRSSLYRLKPI